MTDPKRQIVLAVCLYPLATAVGRGALAQKLVVCLALLWLGALVFQLRGEVRDGVLRQWMRSLSPADQRSRNWERPVRVRYVGFADDVN